MRIPDPPWARLTRPTLAARRARARLTRIVAACCVIAVAVIAVILVDVLIATTDVVVATRTIRRGDVIGAGDVAVVETPRSPVIAGAFSRADDVVGRIAQNDVDESQPLFPTNARDAPVVPGGRTVLQVAVSNDASALVAGDTVRLVSAVGCGQADGESADDGPDGGAPDGEPNDGEPDGGAGTCTIARDALVMKRARRDENGAGTAVVTMAMTPEAAVRVMASAELGAIVAVTR